MTDNIPEHIRGAHFINHEEEPEEWMYYRDLDEYEITTKFRSRFRELNGIFSGNDIRDVVEFGDIWCAAQGCIAFVLEKRGVLLYVIVAADIKDHLKDDKDELIKAKDQNLSIDDFNHTAVTIWPYIVDRDMAWMQGLSSKEIDLVNSIEPDIDN